MANYQIRSRVLLDLVTEIRSGRLILSPYFQRELVWRKTHKQDFIMTILLGYPFPQIFLSRGNIDVEKMVVTSLIVDGQQRMSTIMEFIDGKLDVNNRFFKDFTPEQKSEFLKYEVPVIDLDLPDNDPKIKEIFKRLNRTFYSLTEIEKLSSEYSTSEFMLVAKMLTKQINRGEFEEGIEADEESEEHLSVYEADPNIPLSFIEWSERQNVLGTRKLILERSIFTPYELSRQVHLIFTLNILSTIVGDAFFSRNSKTREFLDQYKEAVPEREIVINNLEDVSNFILAMDIAPNSYWNNKANIFSIIICLYRNLNKLDQITPAFAMEKLSQFVTNIPFEYQNSAKEAVNRQRERVIRNRYLTDLIFENCTIESSV